MSTLLTHTAINKLESSIKDMQKTLDSLKFDDSIKKEIEDLLYKIESTPQKSLIIQMNTVNNVVKPEDWDKEGELTDYFYHVDWIEEPGVYKVVAFEDVYNEDNEGVLIISKTTDKNIVTTTQNLFLGETIMVRKGTTEIPENVCPDFHDCPEWGEWSEMTTGSSSEGGKGYTEIEWNETSKLSDFIEPGIYICQNSKRYTLDDELPITNIYDDSTNTNAYISFTLIVNKAVSFENAPNKYERIGQTLILTNRAGGETKQYVRTLKHDFNQVTNEWAPVRIIQPWKELKGVFNLNVVSDDDLKEYIDNGTYEGVINNGDITGVSQLTGIIEAFVVQSNTIGNSSVFNDGGVPKLPTGSFFTLEVKNNYMVKQYAESVLGIRLKQQITQVAKLQLINGVSAEVSRRCNGGVWSNWYANTLFGMMAAQDLSNDIIG